MEIGEKVKNIIFIVDGGIGKNIAATSVVKSLKEKYKDKRIIVLAGCQEVFFYNPNVYKVFRFDNPLYFYDDYINEESFPVKVEPYFNYGYITKQKHLINSWCEELNLENKKYPDLYFLENELEAAKMYVDRVTKEGKKELILLQWIGGMIPQDKSKVELKGSLAKMFRRAIPFDIAQKIVDILIEKGYVVGNVAHENYPELKNTEKIFFPLRSVLALLKFSKTFIGIDSFLQHASASEVIRKRGIVCWEGTSPICLGYDTNINLTKEKCPTPFCHRPNSYLFDTQPHGATWDCIYGEPCGKYTAEEIIEVFERTFEIDKIKNNKEITETTIEKKE